MANHTLLLLFFSSSEPKPGLFKNARYRGWRPYLSPGMFLPGASSLHCGRLGPKTRSGESGAWSSSSSIGYRCGTCPAAITAEPENASTIGTPANHGADAAAAAADDDDDDDDDGDGVVVRNGSPAD
jgi:hypothetical protein